MLSDSENFKQIINVGKNDWHDCVLHIMGM